MIQTSAEIVIPCAVQKVWDKVVSLGDYAWRSDVNTIDVKDEQTFVEVSKEGILTTLTITSFEPYRCYAFDIDNKNMHGHWKGIFSEIEGKTHLKLEECIEVKHWFMKLFAKGYLKKQQRIYAEDLKRACEGR